MTDNPLLLTACLVLAVCCGLLLGWWVRSLQARTHRAEADAAVADLEAQLAHSQNEALLLQGKYDEAAQTAALLQSERDEQVELNESLAPITSSLARLERQMNTAEQATHKSWGQLVEQITQVSRNTESLQHATSSLSAALSSSSARGVWGEVQLKRLLEHAGMTEHVDFDTQVSVAKGDSAVRPDAVIHLPDGKSLVVDAKAPLAAYLRAAEADDPKAQLVEHTKALKNHVRGLASKEYWSAFESSPEFVVCFLPHEAMLSAACSQDPAIIEEAAAAGVVLTTPATLLAVLRTVAMVWQQDRLTHNIQEVFDTGRELHKRLGTLSGRMTALGKSLQRSVEDYNKLVGSAESRVFPAAKKLIQQGVASQQIDDPLVVNVVPRPLASPEWQLSGMPDRDELITPPGHYESTLIAPVPGPASVAAGGAKPGAVTSGAVDAGVTSPGAATSDTASGAASEAAAHTGPSPRAEEAYSAEMPAAQVAAPSSGGAMPMPPAQASKPHGTDAQLVRPTPPGTAEPAAEGPTIEDATVGGSESTDDAPPTLPVRQAQLPHIPVAE